MNMINSIIDTDSNEARKFIAYLKHNTLRAFETLDTNPIAYIDVAIETAANADKKFGVSIGNTLKDYLEGHGSVEVKVHLFNRIPIDSPNLKPLAIHVGKSLLLPTKCHNTTKVGSKRAKLLVRLSEFYIHSSEISRCMRCSSYALRHLKGLKYTPKIKSDLTVKALSLLASCFRLRGQHSESIACAAEALSVANSSQYDLPSTMSAFEARLCYSDCVAASLDAKDALAEYRNLNEEFKIFYDNGNHCVESFLMISHVRIAGIQIKLNYVAESFSQIEQANALLESLRKSNPVLAEFHTNDIRLIYTDIKTVLGMKLINDGFCEDGIGLLERMALQNPREFLFEYASQLLFIAVQHMDKYSLNELVQILGRSKDAAVGVDLHCGKENHKELAELFLTLSQKFFILGKVKDAIFCATRAARYEKELKREGAITQELSNQIENMNTAMQLIVAGMEKNSSFQKEPKESNPDLP